MRKAFKLVPVILAVAATPAYAQGISGRAELRVGYDQPRAEITIDDFESEIFGIGDLAVGAEVGVDATIGTGLLIGAYAGADFSRVDGCENNIFFSEDAEVDQDEACIDAGRSLTAGLRAGLTTGESGLVYVKGGYSNARLKASYVDPSAGGVSFEDSDTVSGYHVGGGFEVGLSRNIYVKGEYLHHWYKKAFGGTLADTESVDFRRHQLMAGIGIRFGGREPLPVLAPPPPPPPEPMAPATQTCADGSVILATNACPLLPPPPAPAPMPMPGERG
ncbi:MAG: porin family protein [Pseudomonadota bacterium]|nr:porin family protein [Pseudomonadota bacterium]